MVVSNAHKNFIEGQMQLLADYDAQRPVGHAYEFHLHSRRVAESVRELAKAYGLAEDECDILYWATLPHDIGKTALPVSIWDMDDKPSDEIKDERRSHTNKGAGIVRAHFGDECHDNPFLQLMMDIMMNHHEHLDGSGYQGKTDTDLSIHVQLVCICDAFDGYSIHRPHFEERDLSPQSVINRMKFEKSGQYNLELLNLFETIRK